MFMLPFMWCTMLVHLRVHVAAASSVVVLVVVVLVARVVVHNLLSSVARFWEVFIASFVASFGFLLSSSPPGKAMPATMRTAVPSQKQEYDDNK